MTQRLAPTYRAALEATPDEWAHLAGSSSPFAGPRGRKVRAVLLERGLLEYRPDPEAYALTQYRRTEAGRAVLGVLYQPAPDLEANPVTPLERRVAAIVHKAEANVRAAGFVTETGMVAAPLDAFRTAVWFAAADEVRQRDDLIQRLLDGKAGARRDARAHLKDPTS